RGHTGATTRRRRQRCGGQAGRHRRVTRSRNPKAHSLMASETVRDAPNAPPREDEYRPDPDRWMALGVVLAAGFMTLLDVSIVNVALPSIDRGLHAQQNELQWIVSG